MDHALCAFLATHEFALRCGGDLVYPDTLAYACPFCLCASPAGVGARNSLIWISRSLGMGPAGRGICIAGSSGRPHACLGIGRVPCDPASGCHFRPPLSCFLALVRTAFRGCDGSFRMILRLEIGQRIRSSDCVSSCFNRHAWDGDLEDEYAF